MDQRPTEDPRILEALEACRPGSDDVDDPGLASLASGMSADPQLKQVYERLQGVDGAVSKAFRDVPVPEGLAGRILDRLQAARSPDRAAIDEPPPDAVSVDGLAEARPRSRRLRSRRWVLAAGGPLLGTAVAVAVAVGVWFHGQTQEVYSAPAIRDLAIDYFDGDSDEGGHFTPPPESYPVSPDVLRLPDMRWRRVDGFLGQEAVAYDLAPHGRPRATLYVVKRQVPVVPRTPPIRTPQLNSRARSVSIWQSGDLLYVLVVEGGPRTYRGFLNVPSGPLT